MMLQPPLLELRHIQKVYPTGDQGVALAQTLKFDRGEVVGIIGPSGCGKSTLLRLIAGLLEPTDGHVLWSDESAQTPKMRMVFQDAVLLPWLTVKQNIHYSHSRGGISVEDDFKFWIHQLGLSPVLDQYPHQISGGQRMRASFARAIGDRPDVIFLDEPFAALDEPLRIEIGFQFLNYCKAHRPLVFFVTHSITEALTLCDRILVLNGRPGFLLHDEAIPFERGSIEVRNHPDFGRYFKKFFDLLSRAVSTESGVVRE